MSFEYEKVLCPECDGEMISRTGKFGVFWGCKKFPQCKGTRDSMGRSKQDREKEKGQASESDDGIPSITDNRTEPTTFKKN